MAPALPAGVPTTIRANTPNDLLHRLVRGGLPELLAAVEAEGRSLPRFVVREMERFLRCGDPEEGLAWLWCRDCDHHRIVPFSCKFRGFCPLCGGRRMAERAARWVDELFPHVAVRQWVLTIPWPRRWLLARKPKLVRGVHRIAMKEVFAFYRRKLIRSAGKRSQTGSPATGAVTVVQRFSSDLRLNLHFHALVLDGVCARDDKTGKLRFHRAPAVTTAEVAGDPAKSPPGPLQRRSRAQREVARQNRPSAQAAARRGRLVARGLQARPTRPRLRPVAVGSVLLHSAASSWPACSAWRAGNALGVANAWNCARLR